MYPAAVGQAKQKETFREVMQKAEAVWPSWRESLGTGDRRRAWLVFPLCFSAPSLRPTRNTKPADWRSCSQKVAARLPTPGILCVCVCVYHIGGGRGGKTDARQPSQLLCSSLAPLSDSVEGPGRSCGEIPYPPPSQGVWPGGSFPVTVTLALAPASGRQKVRLSTDKHSLY